MRDAHDEVHDAFYAARRSPSLPFVLNEGVQIEAGPHQGERGSVVSIHSLRPTLAFLVELGNGQDVAVEAKHLKLHSGS